MTKKKKRLQSSLYPLLFLLSASGIALEVSLTRLFSYLFTHSYVYIIISVSMAGLGLGSVLMRILQDRLRQKILRTALFLPAFLAGVLLLSSLLQAAVIVSLLTAFFIFMTIGLFQVLVFQQPQVQAGKLYASDLSGAAFGSVAAFLILNALGGMYATLLAASAISLACLLLYDKLFKEPPESQIPARRFIKQMTALLLIIALVLISGSVSSLLPKRSLMKEMTRMLENPDDPAAITDTRWSAFGRVDLVETDNPLFKTLFIDGAAGTKMIEMQEGKVTRETAETLLYQYMGGVPLLAVDDTNKEQALVIGSGGGIDVVTLLLAGYRSIDAVEINPDFIQIVKEESSYNGGIYTGNPQINLIEGEGRSFIRAVDKTYDLILMSLPITKSARNYGNQALTENYLFTSNAFGEYLDKLSSTGFIIIVAHYPNELLKITANAAAALMNRGLPIEEAMKQVVTIGTDSAPALILKTTPFTADEITIFHAVMTSLGLQGTTNFIPGMQQRSREVTLPDGTETTVYEFHPGLSSLAQGEWSIEELNAHSREDIGIVTDNSPFFYQMSKTLPQEVVTVAVISAAILLLIASLFLIKGKLPGSMPFSGKSVLQFASFGFIGLGYMLVEIAFLQKFILFWQHQTLALAIVLSIILISSGAGSYMSGFFLAGKRFTAAILILAVLLTAGPFLVDELLSSTAAAPPVWKFLITLLAAAPPFFFMGMPFPVLLERNFTLRKTRSEYPWMIGINSLASLAGGVFSMVIALAAGYHMVMTAGIICYALLFLTLLMDSRRLT